MFCCRPLGKPTVLSKLRVSFDWLAGLFDWCRTVRNSAASWTTRRSRVSGGPTKERVKEGPKLSLCKSFLHGWLYYNIYSRKTVAFGTSEAAAENFWKATYGDEVFRSRSFVIYLQVKDEKSQVRHLGQLHLSSFWNSEFIDFSDTPSSL